MEEEAFELRLEKCSGIPRVRLAENEVEAGR